MKNYSIILAADEKNGIWKNNTIPWKLKKEQQHFKEVTTKTRNKNKKNVVIMWRKTWESIPTSVRPLPWRINCILSSGYTTNPERIQDDVYGFSSFEACHEFVSGNKEVEEVFIIWGSYLYNLVLDSDYLKRIYLTRVYGDFRCDVFFSSIPGNFKIVKTSEKYKEWEVEYQTFEYKNKGKIFQKLIKPGMILGGVIFLLLIIFLLFQSFTSEQSQIISDPTEVIQPENIPELPSTDPTPIIQEEIPQQEFQEGVSQDSLTGAEVSQEDAWESSIEEVSEDIIDPEVEKSKGSFEPYIDRKQGVTIQYPITNIPQLDEKIQQYIARKSIEYKILSFNEKNAWGSSDIVLDYEVISESDSSIVIMFTTTMWEEVISEEEISY